MKKSGKRKENQNIDLSISNVLSKQKQTMKKAFLGYLGVAIAFLVMALVVFVVGLLVDDVSHSKRIVFVATPIVLCFAIIFACLFLRRFIIFTRINKIKSLSEQTIEITCKKVAFLTQQKSKNYAVIICIVLIDENGKKYYNIVDGGSDRAKKEMRAELLNARVTLNCYADTDYVKAYKVN